MKTTVKTDGNNKHNNTKVNVKTKQQYDIATTYKLCLVGDSATGKTSLLTRFAQNEFYLNQNPTLGMEFQTKAIQIVAADGNDADSDQQQQQNNSMKTTSNNKNACKKLVKLQVWDKPGTMSALQSDDVIHNHSIMKSYYRNVAGILLVYDITNHESFDNLEYWLKEIYDHTHRNSIDDDVVIMLVGNKLDQDTKKHASAAHQQREVTTHEAMMISEKHNLAFIETSALDDNGIEYAFQRLANEIYNRQQQRHHHHQLHEIAGATAAIAAADYDGDGPFDDIDISSHGCTVQGKAQAQQPPNTGKQQQQQQQRTLSLSKKHEGPSQVVARVGEQAGWFTCFNCFFHRAIAPAPTMTSEDDDGHPHDDDLSSSKTMQVAK